MIANLWARLRPGHRRKSLKEQVETEGVRLRALRPQSQIRKHCLRDEKNRLDQIAQALANRPNSKQCGELEKDLVVLQSRCDKMMSVEVSLRLRLEKAGASAEQSRKSAAQSVPVKSFDQDMRRKLEHISAEIRSFWKAKNEGIERTALLRIEESAAVMQVKLTEALAVMAAAIELKKELAELPREQIAINVGSEETLDEINATFAQMQLEADRGNFHKASQRLAGIRELKAHLLSGLKRRRIEAREEVDTWLESSVIERRFPALRKFPVHMTATDIEQWYSLRLQIEEVVTQRAAEQRENNMPIRGRSGYLLTTDNPLRATLADADDDNKLEAFLQAVTAY